MTAVLEKNIIDLNAAKGTPNESLVTDQMLAALANSAAVDVPNGDFRALSAIRLYQGVGSIPTKTVRWTATGTDGSPITCIASRQVTQIVWNGHPEMNPSIRRWAMNCQAAAPQTRKRLALAVALTKARLRERLRDPEGTRFREVVGTLGSQGVALCGEINIRNGFGGFTGYQRFIATAKSLRLPNDEELSSVWIAGDWPNYCTGPNVKVISAVQVD